MKLISRLLFCLLSISLPVLAQDAPVRVTILHANDVYQFAPVDGGTRGGLARLLTIKKETLKDNPNSLFTMGGDTISPSVESLTYKGAQMIDAWNAVGIDYAVLGNHEFDFKTADLLARMKESKFTWLGANVYDTRTNKIFADLPAYVVRDIGGVKIGFIGLLLPETKQTSSMEAALEVRDFCAVAKDVVPKMRAAGVNTIVAVTHLAMAQDKQLAGCAEIDLILGGHEHTLLQSSSHGTPIFKMTADAREAGRFDLYIDKKTGRLTSMDWEVIPVTDKIADAPEFAAVTDKYKDLLTRLAVLVGATSETLDATSLSSRTKETNIGNFIADSYRTAVGADVALINGGSIRADLTYSPGPLTKRDVLSILPFNNQIVKIKMNGKLLREVIEHGVSTSGGNNEPGGFPQVSGMSFKFDVGKPAGSRVTELLVAGKPVSDTADYTLATSWFLVDRGGDGYTMLKNATMMTDDVSKAPRDSEIFEQAIKNAPKSTIAPKVEGRIVRVN
jgi:5'-nucleotidase